MAGRSALPLAVGVALVGAVALLVGAASLDGAPDPGGQVILAPLDAVGGPTGRPTSAVESGLPVSVALGEAGEVGPAAPPSPTVTRQEPAEAGSQAVEHPATPTPTPTAPPVRLVLVKQGSDEPSPSPTPGRTTRLTMPGVGTDGQHAAGESGDESGQLR